MKATFNFKPRKGFSFFFSSFFFFFSSLSYFSYLFSFFSFYFLCFFICSLPFLVFLFFYLFLFLFPLLWIWQKKYFFNQKEHPAPQKVKFCMKNWKPSYQWWFWNLCSRPPISPNFKTHKTFVLQSFLLRIYISKP